MAKNKCPDCEQCLPAWLAAFGDLMSLLLCFFVLLLSMSSMDAKKISEAIGSLSGAMSVLEGGNQTEVSKKRVQKATPIEASEETTEVVNRVQQAAQDANEMKDKGQSATISVEEAQEGFVIQLPASLLFKPGSATVENEDALLFLKRISLIVQELPTDVKVSVQGHTDNQAPDRNSPFRDNWELSSFRALSVLHELIDDGVKPNRISAAGFAQYKPLATNATKSGRAKNRRVEIHFYGTQKKYEKKIQQSVLDKAAAK